MLIANKAETAAALADIAEAYRLGFGDPIPISAQHGEGFAELYARLQPFIVEAEPAADSDTPRPLQLAIVGRPNVGKSTLVNRLLGEDRLLTGPEPGITRDSIAVEWRWRDRDIRLVDTAGMRRRPRIEEQLERLAVADTLRTIRFAETVIVVLDALQPFERQDLTIANLAAEEGRAIVLAANKWDAVPDRGAALAQLRDRMTASLPQLDGIALVPVSGLTGFGLDALMAAACDADMVWNKRVPTPVLNRWLAAIQEHHPPPVVGARRLRLRYITQVNTRPPSFALFASKPGELPESYRRYLVNSLRKDFDLPGTPIRMMLRKGQNPYARPEAGRT
jgi:GTP-binding protein